MKSKKNIGKKGLELKTTLFALVCMGMLFIAVGVMVDQMGEEYNSGVTSDLGGYSKADELLTEAEKQKGGISPQSPETSTDFETTTYRGSYGIITNIFTAARLVFGATGLIQSLAQEFGVPSYIIVGLITMFIFAVIFAIVSIVFRREFT